MATSVDKLENKVQIPHIHPKCSNMVSRLQKSVQYIRRYFTKYAEPRREHATQFPSVSLFSAEATGPIVTKVLHDIVALVALLNHTYTRRYLIPFLNVRATKVDNLPFFTKSVAIATSLEIEKRGPDRSSAAKALSFDEKTAKIGPADPEKIRLLREIIKKEDKKEKKINASKIHSPVGNLAERAKKFAS